jgi:hypothetical protein
VSLRADLDMTTKTKIPAHDGNHSHSVLIKTANVNAKKIKLLTSKGKS